MTSQTFLSQFRRLPPRLHFKILDYIDDPRTISIICEAFPALIANNQYWSLRYSNALGRMTTNLPTQPGAMYHAFIIPQIITLDRGDRSIKLNQALTNVGLYLRSDSKLCRHWVDGINGITESNWPLDKVVEKCIEMRWLFDYCNFRIMLKRYMNKHDLEYNEETFGLAAQETLAEKPVPKKLPWLNDVALRREYAISEPVYDYHSDSEYGFEDAESYTEDVFNINNAEYDSDPDYVYEHWH